MDRKAIFYAIMFIVQIWIKLKFCFIIFTYNAESLFATTNCLFRPPVYSDHRITIAPVYRGIFFERSEKKIAACNELGLKLFPDSIKICSFSQICQIFCDIVLFERFNCLPAISFVQITIVPGYCGIFSSEPRKNSRGKWTWFENVSWF
jgi:hypothetical protein